MSILERHRIISDMQRKVLLEKTKLLPEIAQYLENCHTQDFGLIDGKMGFVLFFLHYAEFTNKAKWKETANELWLDVKERCYADKKNHIVVNYTGDVFKCTAMDFLPDLREGILKDDGTIEMNSRYEMRMKNKYKSKVCSICSIFPICHRGCTRNSFLNKETCLFNESEENKQRIALGRIKWLIKEKRSE